MWEWTRRGAGAIAMMAIVPILGCRQVSPEARSQSLASSATSGANVLPGASVANPVPVRSPRLDDERWQRAMGDDITDKQALADALGATELVEALDDGGDITATALAALPLADDADLALGPLGRRLVVATNDTRGPLLVAILGIAGRPATAREFVDPEGAAEAGSAVLGVAANASLPSEHRAMAVSAARALAEKKIVDPAKIPTDLDPP